MLIQLVLMGRSPWLDEAFGMDRLAWAHRWLGFATVWLIGAHGVLTTIGYAQGDGASVVGEFVNAADDVSVRAVGDGRASACS